MAAAESSDTGGATPQGSAPNFELCIAYSYKKQEGALSFYFKKLQSEGLILEEAVGVNDVNFLKIAAPEEVIGRTAEKLKIRKATFLGLDVPFDWEQRDSYIRQPFDNSLFSWTERYRCIEHLLHRVVADEDMTVSTADGIEFRVKAGEEVLPVLRRANDIKDVFPLHDHTTRKELMKSWGLNWKTLTSPPIDAIHAYFGEKVAVYFAFLGMYTQWLIPPALVALYLYFKDLREWGTAVPVFFSILAVVWSVLFLQFWKRRNAALLTRWGMALDQQTDSAPDDMPDLQMSTQGGIQAGRIHEADMNTIQKHAIQKKEWINRLTTVRNFVVVLVGILFVQLPFELVYAHLNKVTKYAILKFLLTAVYLLAIQFFTKVGGKIAIKLTQTEQSSNREAKADALIYKVFGIYFMQSYIGLFYHALLHRDFGVLRQFLVQRLIIAQIMSNVTEVAVPYATYLYAKYQSNKTKRDKKGSGEKPKSSSRIEKQYLKPAYSSSIGADFEDGLFDDFLELALQFGMVTMFACSFPLIFCFALFNNLIEIHSDAIKLLTMYRRPAPRKAGSIGAWLQIFQYLGVVAICINCALLVCLFDETGKWNVEPGMAAILIMEHLLLLAKFGFSCFVPEEPAWIKAKRSKTARLQEQFATQMIKTMRAES